MRAAAAIAARDLRATFTSPFGYGLVAGYLALAGVLLVVALSAGEARLDGWFAPLSLLTGLLAALLTMRTLAEEERTGSLELLLSAPVRAGNVVLGKLLGVTAVLGVVLAATVTAPLVTAALGDPDAGPIITGYVGVALVGVAVAAIGVAASASTANQLVAAAIAAGVLLATWFGGALAGGLPGAPGALLRYLSPSTHVDGFLRGTIAIADVVYFGSAVALGAVLASLVVRVRR